MERPDNPALTGAVVPTFAYYAGAAMVGLVAITTTSLVDGAFVGNYVGGDALAAVGLLIPCFTVLYATALMLAIGGSVSAGMAIGQGDEAGASAVFSQALIATACFSTIFAGLSLGFDASLYRLLGVPTELVPRVAEYFDVIRWVLVLQLTTMVLYYFVRADGHPALATTALVVGSLSNIGFDALFVIHLDLGLAGSAYGTAVSQVIQAAVLGGYFVSRERTLRFVARPGRWSRLARAAYNGVAELVNEVSAGVVIWLANGMLVARLGVDGVAAFGVVNQYVFLSLMMSYGIADALHLLVSQNYGAGERRRIGQLFGLALAGSLSLGVTLTLAIGLGREHVASVFLSAEDAHVAARAVQLVGVVWPLFLVNATNVIFSCYLTAIDRAGASASIALLRGLVLPATLLATLPSLLAWTGIDADASSGAFLAALPVAEWVTFGVGVALCLRHRPAALDITKTPAPPSAAGRDPDALVMHAH